VRASQRRVVLEYLATRFDEGTDYAEAVGNDLLGRFHEDYASLRRCLVDEGLLTRTAGVYRRTSTAGRSAPTSLRRGWG
jgi:hypothetical protein